MFSSKQSQMRPPKNKAEEYELVPQYKATEKKTKATEKKTVRRIIRCPTKYRIRGPIITDPGGNDPGQTSQPNNDDKRGELEDSLIKFGPFYKTGKDEMAANKEKAWKHVAESLSKVDPGAALDRYTAAIRRVEKEAKEIYGVKIAGTNSEFRLMMVKDGCSFLQLAFLILGRSKEHKKIYFFGKFFGKKGIRKLIKSMFSMGNQIPLVVLEELMKETFFKNLRAQVINDGKSLSLYEKVLYELLVKGGPVLEQQPPCDVLHGLHMMVVGSASPKSKVSKAKEEFDLEDQRVVPSEDDSDSETYIEEDNDQRTFPSDVENNNSAAANGGRLRAFLRSIGLENVIDDHKVIFPCAIELDQAGIRIKKSKSGGIRSIKFENWYIRAYLYLPALIVDDCTEILFRNLDTYDQISKKNFDVNSYLRLMSDMIQTGQDVRLLKKKGIIQGSSDDTENLPKILSRLISSERVTLTKEFHNLRRKIRDYSSPWGPYKGILSFVALLTFLQTFFALLAYFKPPKQ